MPGTSCRFSMGSLCSPSTPATHIQVAIDSGAAASVMPESALPGHPIHPSEGLQSGVHDLAADGGHTPNLGELTLEFITKERHSCRSVFQVATVKRPRLAVSTPTRAGNQVSSGPHMGVS